MASEPYLRTKVDGNLIRCHRVVWEEANGPIPAGMFIHHRNGDRHDNRLPNLEIVSPSEHMKIHQPRRSYPVRQVCYCIDCGLELSHSAAYHNGLRCKPCQGRIRRKDTCLRGHPYPENRSRSGCLVCHRAYYRRNHAVSRLN